jgi:phage protein D
VSVPRPLNPGVPAFAVRVNGRQLEGELAWQIRGVTVEDHVDFPSMFTVELGASDTLGASTPWLDDYKLFTFGDKVVVALGYAGAGLRDLISGEITALEPEFSSDGLPSMAVRGYDQRHRLQRGRKVRTFVKMKDSDIAAKIAREAGLTARVVDSRMNHEYLIQANQTDLQFLQERARRINYEVLIDGTSLSFRPVASDTRPALSLSLATDLSEFRARLALAGQVTEAIVRGWDAKEKQKIETPARKIDKMGGQKHAVSLAQEAFGPAEEVVVTCPVMSREEADRLAQARLDALSLSLIQGEGVCPGRPELRAGKVIDIQGVGKRFSGPYYVVSASHRYGPAGYSTHFTVWRNAT